MAAVMYSRITFAADSGFALINHPDEAWIELAEGWVKLTGAGGSVYTHKDVRVEVKSAGNAQSVYVQSPTAALMAVRFKWKYETKKYSKILGDHWERTYGDLAWKKPEASAKNPWYVLLHDDKQTAAFGVKTGGNTISFWNVTADSLELTMDTHSGGRA